MRSSATGIRATRIARPAGPAGSYRPVGATMTRRRAGVGSLIVVAALALSMSPAFPAAAADGQAVLGIATTRGDDPAITSDFAGRPSIGVLPAHQYPNPPERAFAGGPTSPIVNPNPEGPPTDQTTLKRVRTIRGQIRPKSVVASGAGFVIAENMMYRHTVTVYDTTGELVRTVKDKVNLAALGWPAYPKPVTGAPVEAAFSPDGQTAYVTNYSMYGPGFTRPGWDLATPADKVDDSFVYRIDMAGGKITGAARVGAVPKFIAASPDGRWIIVANWTSWDLSVIDVATFREVKRIPVGPEPRGIAFLPDSSGAFVTTQYHDARRGYPAELYRLDVADWKLTAIRTDLGRYPRHIVLDADGRYLYASMTGDVTVIKLDTTTGKIVGSVRTGAAPRTIVLSDDGLSLYVVNYDDDTLVKIETADMRVVQRLATGHHPVGVTFEPATRTVWVSCYSGTLMLFREGG
ncbi:MAG: YncE family protein [Chloroflexota bacterium]